jgi:hypothetical protein
MQCSGSWPFLLATFRNVQCTEYGRVPQQTQLERIATLNHSTAEILPPWNLEWIHEMDVEDIFHYYFFC